MDNEEKLTIARIARKLQNVIAERETAKAQKDKAVSELEEA